MKVLHLPDSVGDNAWTLSRAERAHGIKSDVLFINGATIYEAQSKQSDIPEESLTVRNPFKRVANTIDFYKWAVQEYDVLHFNWGRTILSNPFSPIPPIELPFLSRSNAAIVVTYQGSDSRQEGYCLRHYDITHAREYSTLQLARYRLYSLFKRQHISMFGKYADLIYATNPDLLNVLPEGAKFRPYTKCEIGKIRPVLFDGPNHRMRIVHAPTSRNIKGTKYIVATIDKLKKEGFDIDLILVENKTNKEAMEIYKKADVIIDQLLIGWYGGFAVECLALGKPVIAYLRETDLDYLPQGMRDDMPIINASPQSLYATLRAILEGKTDLREISHDSVAYVNTWHSEKKIAASIIKDYEKALRRT